MLSGSKKFHWLLVILVFLFMGHAYAHGMSDAEKQSILEGGNLRYIWIGATHMLSGYDHLAFVFGIIFFLTKFKDIVKYVTAFTLGHSTTLIFATLNGIQINYFLIDALIALSVCYIAFVNLDGFKRYLHTNPPNMLVMIVTFGLIHGLGLSTRLQELTLSEDHLLMNIISFNLGIELGQIGALTAMLLILAAFRNSDAFNAFSKIANSALVLLGIFLFFVQMHDYEHAKQSKGLSANNESSLNMDHMMNLSDLNDNDEPWRDTILVTIPAHGEKEYKLLLAKDASFQYAWQSENNALFFDFHGEPTGDTTGFFKSFLKSTDKESSGFLTSEFAGPHGWYWKNNHTSAAVITLKLKGDYELMSK